MISDGPRTRVNIDDSEEFEEDEDLDSEEVESLNQIFDARYDARAQEEFIEIVDDLTEMGFDINNLFDPSWK